MTNSKETLIGACDRLLQTEQQVKEMPKEQRDWFFGKAGHADCFMVAKALKEHLQRGEIPVGNALTDVLTGGNHLASAMMKTCPPGDIKTYDEALERHGQPYADMWIAWHCIMMARPYLKRESGSDGHDMAEIEKALRLAEKWLMNCVPVGSIQGPKPLPVIRAALAIAEKRNSIEDGSANG